MSISIGIVGLPNVGKSTLFQALTKHSVDRAEYPFCTIDPNIGVLEVPDHRLDALSEISGITERRYATIEFVDIAGLVRGAHRGEGLGNQFLAHVRDVDAIVYVLRAFASDRVPSTEPTIDPVRDKEILDTELVLKDLETVKKRLEERRGAAKTGDKEARREIAALETAEQILAAGSPLAGSPFIEESAEILAPLRLLTTKAAFAIVNVGHGTPFDIRSRVGKASIEALVVNVADEFGAAELSDEERAELGVPSALSEIIKTAYRMLGLITFFTIVGGREAHAWALKEGTPVVEAARRIHQDFADYFIRADVAPWDVIVAAGGMTQARERGQVRTEGREYSVRDGDVVHIKHGSS